MADSVELRSMAKEELSEIDESISRLEKQLMDDIEADKFDEIDEGVIEVRPGTGGEEAGYFAHDLYNMYINGLKELRADYYEQTNDNTGFMIKCHGKMIFKYLRFEAGVHRVQRVPETDTKGRVHTSTVSVAVLPAGKKSSLVLDLRDLKIESFRSSGPGGQNANMANSAVRVTHIPTGIAVCNQEERSNSANKEKAMAALVCKLQEKENEKEFSSILQMRRAQVKSSHRSDKIRTYNVCQNRVTDHYLSNANYAYDMFMTGKYLPGLLKEKRAKFISEWITGQGK